MVVVSVPLAIALGVGSAYVLTKPRRGRAFYRTAFFLPTMVPAVAAAVAFLFLLNAGGPIDHILGFLHLPQPLWFLDAQWSKPGLVVIGLWGVGSTMIIFLAALLDVPTHLYEAADIEGANAWQKFRHITLPMISPVIFFTAVIGVIYGFQYFTEAYVVGASIGGAAGSSSSSLGSPQGSTLFYTIWLYQQGFEAFHLGYASAMAWMLFAIVMACTLILIKSSNRWVFYQGGFK
jgi:multiple sugar transport system permease protein